MRLTRALLACCLVAAFAPSLRAEYFALRNGQRLHVTSYELLGDKYRLRIAGGTVEVAVTDVANIEPEEVFVSVPAQRQPTTPLGEIVKAAAARYAVDQDLIMSVIAAESNFDPKAVSKRNAKGLMQLLPETAALFNVVDIFDPKENIEAGTHYLSELLKQYNNDLTLALAAYNAGPEKVTQYGRVPPYRETVSYVSRVKRVYDQSKSGHPPAVPQAGNTKPSDTSGLFGPAPSSAAQAGPGSVPPNVTQTGASAAAPNAPQSSNRTPN